jgi:hypothetical protein
MKSKIKMWMKLMGLIILIISTLLACEEPKSISEVDARNEIMKQHELQRKYHFEKMAEEFASQLSSNHISVNKGEIKKHTKEEHLNRLDSYFNSVEFEKWDDINPPIIRFSDDYSLAYTIVDKEVIVNYNDDDGVRQKELTKFSWVAIYKRFGKEWKIDCVASTNKESEILE